MEGPAHKKRKEEREEGNRTWRREEDQTSCDQRSSCQDKQSDTKRRDEVNEAKFVNTRRSKLIQRVVMVMPIADELLDKGMISDEQYSEIEAAATRQRKMRELYNALISGGVKVKSAFYRILQEREAHLVQDLGGTSQTTQSSARQPETTTQTAKWDRTQSVIKAVKQKNKGRLRKEFSELFDGTEDEKTPLKRIYTPLYITKGESDGVNKEHEIRQIEYPSRGKPSSDSPINCNDIFKPQDEKGTPTRAVLTKGIAGIGKTVSVQKFIQDWAEGEANKDVDFIFVLPFRELNLIQDDQYSLRDLLCYFNPELTEMDESMFVSCKVLFIFDGLDESKLPFNFSRNKRLSDVTKTSSVDVLLTNLIKGHLLPSALLWITTRPAAAKNIERKCIDQMTEVRGFTDQQKDEYFTRKFSDDEKLAQKIIRHIKKTKSLHIMCYIPVMCFITAKVLEHMLLDNETGEIPTTLTEMYIDFLIIQTELAQRKYEEENETDTQKILQSSTNLILKLAQLAFQELMKGNIIFYEEDLKVCRIDVDEAVVKCGLCTEILKVERGLHKRKVFCFVHLSFQEFLAALYVFYCCAIKNFGSLASLLKNVSPTEMPLHEGERESRGRSSTERERTSGPVPPLPSWHLAGVQPDPLTRPPAADREQPGDRRGDEEIPQEARRREHLPRETSQSLPLLD